MLVFDWLYTSDSLVLFLGLPWLGVGFLDLFWMVVYFWLLRLELLVLIFAFVLILLVCVALYVWFGLGYICLGIGILGLFRL